MFRESFSGEFRRRPVQSLGGDSSQAERKEDLLKRAEEERQKREEHRRQHECATKIQSFVRSRWARCKLNSELRRDFDVKRQAQIYVFDDFIKPLLHFYNERLDADRLIWLCQLVLKEKASFVSVVDLAASVQQRYQLKKLLHLCARYLENISSSQVPYAVPLRMLEVFTDAQTFSASGRHFLPHLVFFLIKNGYFKSVRAMLVGGRVPGSLLECDATPPTPLAASLLGLVIRPLALCLSDADTEPSLLDFRLEVVSNLCVTFLCEHRQEPQVAMFLLPALAAAIVQRLPLATFLHVLRLCVLHKQDGGAHVVVPRSLPLLHAVVTMISDCRRPTDREFSDWLLLLQLLVPSLVPQHAVFSSEDSESTAMNVDEDDSIGSMRTCCLEFFNSEHFVRNVMVIVENHISELDSELLGAAAMVAHGVIAAGGQSVYQCRLLYTLAFRPSFVRYLWHHLIKTEGQAVQTLCRGVEPTQEQMSIILPLLTLFCTLFAHSLSTLYDSEFHGASDDVAHSSMAFSIVELVPLSLVVRDLCLGLIELSHPFSLGGAHGNVGQHHHWQTLFGVTVSLLKQLNARDTRQPYCPRGHWLTSRLSVPYHRGGGGGGRRGVAVPAPFPTIKDMARRGGQAENGEDDDDDGSPPLAIKEQRQLVLLKELPFVMPFEERVLIFRELLRQDKEEHQGGAQHFLQGAHISVHIRRNYIYEDAFEKLSPQNEPNMKLYMRVHLANYQDVDEAGVDGGGLFREFLSELLVTAFDPNRGLFRQTQDQQQLYPNPRADDMLIPQHTQHYYFLGRCLAKAIYENLLVELPFAGFFLSKILSRRESDVDIHHLATLDPLLYKNLLYLKEYEDDVADLNLDFSVMSEHLGSTRIEDLKPNGRNVLVTNDNLIEYIHLMANYKLNVQMRLQSAAFKQGLNDVVNIDWLRMFDYRELQVLISGAHVPIDTQDMRQNTVYQGFTDDHPTIMQYWEAVESFTEEEKSSLLKFITSCSRPPLLGFKELYPRICVQNVGADDRLPTASTCMNLLKLPEFKDYQQMRERLHYAITSSAGFELS